MNLNKEQLEIVRLITAGHNVLVHGNMGTGKSTAIRESVVELKRLKKTFYLTASTGVAANTLGNYPIISNIFGQVAVMRNTKN